MKKLALALVSLCWLAFAGPAFATNVNIDGLPAASSAGGTDLLECEQSGTNNKCTSAQEAAYVYGLMSGDATAGGTGAVTFKTVNSSVGSFGSATNCTAFTTNAKGLITAASATTCTPAIASITGMGTGVATALAIAPGTTGSFTTQDGAIVTGNCLKWGPGVQDAGAACGSGGGSGTVTSVTPGAGVVSSVTAAYSQSAITSTGTVSAAEAVNAQSGTSYAILDGDRAKLITGTNSAAQAYSIAQAGAASAFQTGWFARVQNKGTGALTITPTTSTINGASSYVVYPGQTIKITSDGTNYQVDAGSTGSIAVNPQTGSNYAFASSDFGKLVNLSNASAQTPTLSQATGTFGAGWYTQVCNQGAGVQTITPTTSTIGGASTYALPAGSAPAPKCIGVVSDGTNYQVVPSFLANATTTIASGTAAMGTTAIASGACATVVTVSATGVATTDTVMFGYNGDPTGVTGYGASASGAVLSVYPYPTANNVNVKVCNSSSGSITPGAMTLNFRVTR